jgi:hypothetical protein
MPNEMQYFQILKTKLQATMQASYPHFNRAIHEWKAQEIMALQTALHEKVKGYISEKWFYTHLKPLQNDKLPRIDMLDMLAQYVGYANWQDFTFQQQPPVYTAPAIRQDIHAKPKTATKLYLPALKQISAFLIISLVGFALLGFWKKDMIQFCFQDADTQKPIYQDIEVRLLKEGESPQLQKIDKNGCLKIPKPPTKITFVVKSAYYRTDTITRTPAQMQAQEVIKLKKDDYALLIQLIAKQGTTPTEKEQRKKKLERMIDEEAQIFQIDDTGLGIELYSKTEFIDKLALPISSLKDLQIIEIQYEQSKISLLRFLQK